MRSTTALLCGGLAMMMLACTSEQTLTEPETPGTEAAAAPSLVLASNTWTAKAPIPGDRLYGLSAGVAPNSAGRSIVYLFGGHDGGPGTTFHVQAYDVTTNTWTTKAPRTYRTRMNGVGKIGSKLYFSGGFQYGSADEYSAELYAYDPSADRLIRKRDMPRHTAEGVTGVIDGKLYVVPGTCSGEFWPDSGYCPVEPIRELYRYDPAANAWAKMARSPHFHRHGAGGVINGKFYVVGGLTDGYTPAAYLDVYDPATNTWKTLAPVPTAGRVIGAVLGGKLFVIVGSGSERRAYAYHPGTNTWKIRAAPKWDHSAVVRVTLDGRAHLLAVGGSNGLDIPNDSELYTP